MANYMEAVGEPPDMLSVNDTSFHHHRLLILFGPVATFLLGIRLLKWDTWMWRALRLGIRYPRRPVVSLPRRSDGKDGRKRKRRFRHLMSTETSVAGYEK